MSIFVAWPWQIAFVAPENLHRRLDPVIENVAANSAKIEAFEFTVREAAKAATIGGKK